MAADVKPGMVKTVQGSSLMVSTSGGVMGIDWSVALSLGWNRYDAGAKASLRTAWRRCAAWLREWSISVASS